MYIKCVVDYKDCMKRSSRDIKLSRSEVLEIIKEGQGFLTPEEAGMVLRVKPSWFYANIHFGTLPFKYVKVGQYVRIPALGIKKYIEAQLQDGSAA